ncbi:MAG: caspase family protein [Gammaproteobacteria bacterium]|nr:caspase family protein [Gammaproteobacteria bacterium]
MDAQEPIDFGDDSSMWAFDGECDDPRFVGEVPEIVMPEDAFRDATDCRDLYGRGLVRLRESEGATETPRDVRVERGELQLGDPTLDSGEYVDSFTVTGVEGTDITVELRSTDFDTFLILRAPNGDQLENDDYLGDETRSLIGFTVLESGSHEIGVTSFNPGETGQYTLHIRKAQEATRDLVVADSGALSDEDAQLPSGEYADFFEFEVGTPGRRFTAELSSPSFDAYLAVMGPQGFLLENDDADNDTTDSFLEGDLPERGEYAAIVTTFEQGETGSYEFKLVVSDVGDTTSSERLSSERLTEGTVKGRIEASDGLLESGRYYDMYTLEASSEQTIVIDLRSADFDTVLRFRTPDGFEQENDDFEGSTDRSLIETVARQSGRYDVLVTSYGRRETGEYDLTLRLGDSVREQPVVREAVGGESKVHGLFVGISDYPGDYQDLPHTAVDATVAFESLVSSDLMGVGDGILLTESTATRDNFVRSIEEISARADGNDVIVIFFSGHGGRRQTESDLMDPDGFDETLVLFDSEITDDELRNLIRDTKGESNVLVVLDACFSGGFQKDLISMPGIMGVFSSEENVTSAVAEKFRAGGFLALFFSDGVRGEADADGNGAITALELGHYLSERYRVDVVAEKGRVEPESFVRVSANLAYQRLVLDHSAIGHDQVLFRRVQR